MLITEDAIELGDDTYVTVVTPHSRLDLQRCLKSNIWSFPSGSVRSAPAIVVTLPAGEPRRLRETRISTSESASTRDAFWRQVEFSASEEQNEYHLNTGTLGNSRILGLIDRRSINWKGDLHFLIKAAGAPATLFGSVWLVAMAVVWFHYKVPKPSTTDTATIHTKLKATKISGLDHLRGIAIIMVIAYHSLFATFGYDQLGWDGWFRSFDHARTFLAVSPLSFGFGGVGVFFGLSGFCIHLSYERSKEQGWITYFWRRFFRIYPPYFLALVFFAFCLPLTRVDLTSDHGLWQFYSRVFMCFNLSAETYWGVNGSFWSVAVEMQLYLVYPLLYVAARKLGWTPVLVLSFLIELSLHLPAEFQSWLMGTAPAPFWLTMGPLGYVFSWTVGAKLADDFIHGRRLLFSQVPLGVWACLLVLSLMLKPLALFQFMLFSLTTISLIIRCIEHRRMFKFVPNWLSQHVAWVGTISYSLYLLHQPFLNLASKFAIWLNNGEFVHPALRLLSCLFVYPCILLLAWLMYRYVELPSIEAGKQFVRSRTAGLRTSNARNELASPAFPLSS